VDCTGPFGLFGCELVDEENLELMLLIQEGFLVRVGAF
jgi:hypothetical protein